MTELVFDDASRRVSAPKSGLERSEERSWSRTGTAKRRETGPATMDVARSTVFTSLDRWFWDVLSGFQPFLYIFVWF